MIFSLKGSRIFMKLILGETNKIATYNKMMDYNFLHIELKIKIKLNKRIHDSSNRKVDLL